MRRIGVLMNLSEGDREAQRLVATFREGLAQLGWTAGRNLRIDYRWSAGDNERIRRYAAELVALAPDVILAYGGSVVGPLQQVTHTVPIVFVEVIDPVGAGFVTSLARPGGNATGFSLFEFGISGKWVAQSSVAKYMVKRRAPPSQGWRTFLHNHAPDIAALDLFVVPTIGFDLLYRRRAPAALHGHKINHRNSPNYPVTPGNSGFFTVDYLKGAIGKQSLPIILCFRFVHVILLDLREVIDNLVLVTFRLCCKSDVSPLTRAA